MDSEDEAMPYSKLLNENSVNYLIQNNYELQDCLSVEPIFTEMENGTWSPEAFPIISSGPRVNENSNRQSILHNESDIVHNQTDEIISSQVKLNKPKTIEDSLELHYENRKNSSTPTQILTLSQDDHNDTTHNTTSEYRQEKQKSAKSILLPSNGNTYSISYCNDKSIKLRNLKDKMPISDERNEMKNKIIQISDPTVNDTSSVQHNDHEDNSTSDCLETCVINEFHSVITARKCKVCSYICESLVDITNHLKEAHEDLIKIKQDSVIGVNVKQKMEMRSLLDANTALPKNGTAFMCGICDNIFATEVLLINHLKTHSEEDNISELDESELTSASNETAENTMKNLATLLLNHQKEFMKKLKCSVEGCNLKFPNDESKIQHEECHMADEKQFQCNLCQEKFFLWHLCCKHLWTCHKIDAGLYECSLCNNYKSISPVAVMKHMDSHSTAKPFECPVCRKGFKRFNQMKNHKVIHDRQQKSPSLKLRCTICERFFANNKSLRIHIETVHEKSKPYICNVCGHRTSRKAFLEVHFRQHTGEKPYQCPHCTYKSSDHNSLRKHIMKHLSCMQYSCPYCEYQSIQSSAYKNHLNTKHPGAEEIFKCGYCKFTSLNSDMYLTHVKCHEHEQKKNVEDNTSITMNTDEARPEDNESQIYLHLPDNYDCSENMGYSENIDDPAAQ